MILLGKREFGKLDIRKRVNLDKAKLRKRKLGWENNKKCYWEIWKSGNGEGENLGGRESSKKKR